jgi:hypothetical protein
MGWMRVASFGLCHVWLGEVRLYLVTLVWVRLNWARLCL